MLAYDYPILGLFWTMLIFFLWMAWIILLFRVFADIFRNKEASGISKALWTIFVILVPFLGVFIYLCVEGRHMAHRDLSRAQENEAAFQSYVRETAGSGASSADELAKLAELHSSGVLSDAEFATQKAKILA
jgi:hypothetical protein